MPAGETQYEKGMRIRREVVGDDYVDRALEHAGEFAGVLQDYLATNCWGTVWAREELPRSTRSLVTLAILASTNKWTELTTHVRGAIRNGCSPEEIREVFLQLFVYAGAPAALEAFRHAEAAIAAAADKSSPT
jgi:4-carboxymuconolactone decarboxylase